MHRVESFERVFLLLFVALVAGCSNDRLPTFAVQGQVVFSDGSPVRTGSIELKSVQHSVQARGDIASDGSFQLTTYEENDGAVEGVHKCVVVQLVMVEELSNFKPSTEGVVDPRFGSYTTSELECRISESDDNRVKLTVEPIRLGAASTGKASDPPLDHAHQHDHKHDAHEITE
ncbi:MAG: hypothetical protein H8E66_25940 [Planctomycetes bacterium]|nr:hypothetical protein [Planctomycetota bacterium]